MFKDTIVEDEIIYSIEGYKTKKSEERKGIKLRHANKIALIFVIGYFTLLFFYILLPILGFCKVPSTITILEKIGTTLLAGIFGFYFGTLKEK